MSRFNIKVTEIAEDEDLWLLEILSCDFSNDGTNQVLGWLEISKDDNALTFLPGGIWEEKLVVPIDTFGMLPDEARRVFKDERYDQTCNGWIKNIYARARLFISEKGSTDL